MAIWGWNHSFAAGDRARRRADPSYLGTKTIVAIWTRKPAKEGDQLL